MSQQEPFDFAAHRRRAVAAYRDKHEVYHECALAVSAILRTALRLEEIKVQAIEARGKSLPSFAEKCEKRDPKDPGRPKYPEPLTDITDLAGVRVIVFLPAHINKVSTIVSNMFRVDTSQAIRADSGYRGEHHLVRFDEDRRELIEYRSYADLTVEIQVRTVLQHAWAEVEHGIVYKPNGRVPQAVRNSLQLLSRSLEVSDDQLQLAASEAEDANLIEAGQTSITPSPPE